MATSTGLASPAASYASDTELAVFIPEIWADAVRASFKKNLVLGNLGTDFSALIANGGDIVNVPSVADVANAAAKAKHIPVNYTNATEDQLQITVQTHKYASAMLDDMGVVQASADLLSMYSDSIGYKLALGFDTDVEAALALTRLTKYLNIAGGNPEVMKRMVKKGLLLKGVEFTNEIFINSILSTFASLRVCVSAAFCKIECNLCSIIFSCSERVKSLNIVRSKASKSYI